MPDYNDGGRRAKLMTNADVAKQDAASAGKMVPKMEALVAERTGMVQALAKKMAMDPELHQLIMDLSGVVGAEPYDVAKDPAEVLKSGIGWGEGNPDNYRKMQVKSTDDLRAIKRILDQDK